MEKNDWLAITFILLYSTTLFFLINPDKTLNWDESVHALPGLFYIDFLHEGGNYLEYVAKYHQRYPVIYSLFKYPQLYELTTIPLYALFGQSVITSTLPTLMFGAIALCFLYLFAKQHSNSGAALLSIITLAALPLTIRLSTEVMQDNAKQALTIIWLYYFFKKKDFSWKKTGVQGVILAYLTFSRNLALPIMASIVIAYSFLKTVSKKKLETQTLKRFLPQLIIALILVSPWYYMSLIRAGFLQTMFELGTSANENAFPFYEKEIILETGLLAPLMLWGAYKLHKKEKGTCLILLAVFLGTLFFGDLLPHKRLRYMTQVFLPLSIWAGYGIQNLFRKNKITAPLIIAILIFSFYNGFVRQQAEISVTDVEETINKINPGKDDLIIYFLNNRIDYGKASPEAVMLELMKNEKSTKPSEMPYLAVSQFDKEDLSPEKMGLILKNTVTFPELQGYENVYLAYYEQDGEVKAFVQNLFPEQPKIQGENLTILLFEKQKR